MKAKISDAMRSILNDPRASKELPDAIRTARSGQATIIEAGGKKYQVFTDAQQAADAYKKLERTR